MFVPTYNFRLRILLFRLTSSTNNLECPDGGVDVVGAVSHREALVRLRRQDEPVKQQGHVTGLPGCIIVLMGGTFFHTSSSGDVGARLRTVSKSRLSSRVSMQSAYFAASFLASEHGSDFFP